MKRQAMVKYHKPVTEYNRGEQKLCLQSIVHKLYTIYIGAIGNTFCLEPVITMLELKRLSSQIANEIC